MLLRPRKTQKQVVEPAQPRTQEELLEAIQTLSLENRDRHDPELERRILDYRHRAGSALISGSNEPTAVIEPDFEAFHNGGPSGLPGVSSAELTPGRLRAGILTHGCLLVHGLLDPDEADSLRDDVERVFAGREAFLAGNGRRDGYYEELEPEPPYDLEAQRNWVTEGGGIFVADSPRVMFEVLDKLERAGVQRVIREYLGERPAISVNKCTLRRVRPGTLGGWHQDGAFLGGEVRAMNAWIALTRCGDEAPGMDIVPHRLDQIVETGTEGAWFDWSVSPAIAEAAAGEVGILRPIFEAGDMLLFDDLFLHATATDPSMTKTRYAIESWFFGPSGFPSGYVPLAF